MNNLKYLISLFLFILLIPLSLSAQSEEALEIQSGVSRSDIEINTRFLSSDELKGRATGSPGLELAASYIASWFSANGVEPAPGFDTYFQNVPLISQLSPEGIEFSLGDSTFTKNKHLLLLNNYRGRVEAPVIVLDYATNRELLENDVKGKIVIAKAGLPGETSPQQLVAISGIKMDWIAETGAAGLIEMYANPRYPWQVIVRALGTDRNTFNEENQTHISRPHLWMNGVQSGIQDYIAKHDKQNAELTVSGKSSQPISTKNVIGVVQGSDPELKDEYILLSAHYDHLGVTHTQDVADSIYNGARDNAVGVAAVLSAGKYFAKHPPKRSIILAAWTAEESGLLGSGWFVDHPMIPLDQIFYNLNIDNAGYNDTTKVTIVGFGRTEADSLLKTSAEAFDLEAIPDPVPQQGLFDRSDNVHFARKGIPAPTFCMGFTAFDDELSKYYHQVDDEANTLDFDYVTKYVRSYILSAQKIANTKNAPFWIPGDEYEQAGIKLYGM